MSDDDDDANDEGLTLQRATTRALVGTANRSTDGRTTRSRKRKERLRRLKNRQKLAFEAPGRRGKTRGGEGMKIRRDGRR